MHITFIKPNIGRMEHSLYVDEGRMEPLSLGVVAALTPPDVECALYDDRMEAIPFDEATDLVAINVQIYTARRAYEIASEYRARGVPVILGGFHPTLVPDECLRHADSVYVGDAEFRWAEVVEDARRGRLRQMYRAPRGRPQVGGVAPRRDLYRAKGYLPLTLAQFGRGCRFACDFCAVSVFFERSHYTRPPAEIVAELERRARRFVFFVDDNFLADHGAAKAFLRELIPLRIKWVSQGSIDMADDPELMDLMAASGCMGHVIGFESVNPEILRRMGKEPNLARARGAQGWDRYRAQCEVLRSYHLQTWAAFTLGYDGETAESVREVFDFAMDGRFCFAAFNILMPYPGTPLYDRLRREDRLLYDGQWWLHPEYRFNNAAFVPSHMTPDELTEACWTCRDRWNRAGSIFRRLWDPKTHLSSPLRLATYLRYNPLFARETRKKHGMRFGLDEKTVAEHP